MAAQGANVELSKKQPPQWHANSLRRLFTRFPTLNPTDFTFENAPMTTPATTKIFVVTEQGVEKINGAPCRDCGKHTEPITRRGRPLFRQWDFYIVRDEVWMEAGMGPWDSGFLCTPCLRARLGRDLTDDDYLGRCVGVTKAGLQIRVKPEYVERVNHGRGY